MPSLASLWCWDLSSCYQWTRLAARTYTAAMVSAPQIHSQTYSFPCDHLLSGFCVCVQTPRQREQPALKSPLHLAWLSMRQVNKYSQDKSSLGFCCVSYTCNVLVDLYDPALLRRAYAFLIKTYVTCLSLQPTELHSEQQLLPLRLASSSLYLSPSCFIR